MYKVLIASPVKQIPEILKEFLLSIENLKTEGISVSYVFADDNDEPVSSQLLAEFSKTHKACTVIKSSDIVKSASHYTENHNWNYNLIDRIADIKNFLIDFAVKTDCTHIFFIDSDIVLNPETLLQLLSDKVNIVSNVFWTRFSKWDQPYPQVWLMDHSACFDPRDPRTKNRIFREASKNKFIEELRVPGIYKIGGLGACTLISRDVLQSGVNFSRLYNVSFWGEDRAFCIRATAHNFSLYVDTHYPAYHIYRREYLSGIESYRKNGYDFSFNPEKLTFKEHLKAFGEKTKRNIRLFIWEIFYKNKKGA